MTSLDCTAYINGEKSPNPPPPFLSFPSSAIPLLLPPASGPLLLHPPILPPSHHSLTLIYAFISFPKSPQSSHPLPPCFKFQVYIEWVHIKTSTFLEARTGYCCIHRVKQTIVHMIHMILSRSVHQIAYGDVIKAFCKKNLPTKDTSE